MDLCNITEIKALLARHGFHFSKAKGQNFLIAPWVPESIARESGVEKDVGVLEIGPGIGPLTQQLSLRAGKVCAVEVDERLKPILDITLADCPNVEILWGDVLKQDIPALVKEKLGSLRPMACANLPYYITSPIVMKLLGDRLPIESLTVMVQKEVAQRICSAPGRGEYGAFSVFCQYYAEPELLFDVPASCFIPQPKVTARRKKDEMKAKLIEDMLRNELDRMPFEQLNDMMERTVPIQGGAAFLVEGDNTQRTHFTIGELAVSTLHPKQIVPQDGVYTGVEDMDYIILKIPQTKEYIRRKYGVLSLIHI